MNTKKIILSLLLISSTIGFSQIRLGAKAGLNVASLTGEFPAYLNSKSKIGFHAGLTAEIPFKVSKFSLLGELLVSTQGVITERTNDAFDTSIGNVHEEQKQNLKLTNINLPVLLRYRVIKKLSIEAGPQFGYIVSAKTKIEYTNSAFPQQNETIDLDNIKGGTFVSGGTTYSYKSTINRFDLGLNIGATYDITNAFYVQTRYNFGLTDVDKRSTNGSSINSWKLKNSVFQLSAGYRFN